MTDVKKDYVAQDIKKGQVWSLPSGRCITPTIIEVSIEYVEPERDLVHILKKRDHSRETHRLSRSVDVVNSKYSKLIKEPTQEKIVTTTIEQVGDMLDICNDLLNISAKILDNDRSSAVLDACRRAKDLFDANTTMREDVKELLTDLLELCVERVESCKDASIEINAIVTEQQKKMALALGVESPSRPTITKVSENVIQIEFPEKD